MLAFVLRRRDLREYDQMISFYTRETGKIDILAKGIKKITSKNSSAAEPPALCEIEIAGGKDMAHLTKVQPVELYANIRKSLAKSAAAAYALRILEDFTLSGERDERVFLLVLGFLKFLDESRRFGALDLVNGYLLKLWDLFGFGGGFDKTFRLQATEKDCVKKYLGKDWGACAPDARTAAKINKLIGAYVGMHSEKPLADFAKDAKILGII